MQFGAPKLVVWGLWGMAWFTLLRAGTLGKRIAALPFGLAHWGHELFAGLAGRAHLAPGHPR